MQSECTLLAWCIKLSRCGECGTGAGQPARLSGHQLEHHCMVCNVECAGSSTVWDNLGILIGGGEWRSGHGETATLTHPPL